MGAKWLSGTCRDYTYWWISGQHDPEVRHYADEPDHYYICPCETNHDKTGLPFTSLDGAKAAVILLREIDRG